MKQRVRKPHTKSRTGCHECKKRHHKCDESYPVCGHCTRLGTTCSLSEPSPNLNSPLQNEGLNIDDLRLLHHWHNAAEDDDFAPFVDHGLVDKRQHYNRTIDLSFRHPYLLHSVLSLSALHLLNGADRGDAKLYQLASAHNLSAMRLARPQVAKGETEHRDAIFSFAAFAALYATAEPPLRAGDATISTPTEAITGLLDAFKMSKGVRAVQDPFIEELKASKLVDLDLWKDNRDDLVPTLETDYPQLVVLERMITEECSERVRQPCLDAIRMTFVIVAVFMTNHKNHPSLRNIQTWPMDLDPICLEMFEAHHPIGLVILAHYAALMGMRSNYWFCKRWPRLLLDSVTSLLPAKWQEYLEYPRSIVQAHCVDNITNNGESLTG